MHVSTNGVSRYAVAFDNICFFIQMHSRTTTRMIERAKAQSIVDQAAKVPATELTTPRLGWIRTVRNALGMTGDALSRRLGLSRSASIRLESSEANGGISLNSLQAAADAMGCRLVYAFVPKDVPSIDDLVHRQAELKARQFIDAVSPHMALEGQSLTDEDAAAELRRLTSDLVYRLPRELWDD